jgi:hypothetical protein
VCLALVNDALKMFCWWSRHENPASHAMHTFNTSPSSRPGNMVPTGRILVEAQKGQCCTLGGDESC